MDKSYYERTHVGHSFVNSDMTSVFEEEIIVTYADIDQLIKFSSDRLTDNQLKIIKYLMSGYFYNEIAKIYNIKNRVIKACVRNIYRILFDEYQNRRDGFLSSISYIKINPNEKFKQCTKCKRWLKMDSENFSPNAVNVGFQAQCKICKSNNYILSNHVELGNDFLGKNFGIEYYRG